VWVELALLFLICAAVVFARAILRRRDSGPATYWVTGWLAGGAGAILGVVRDEYPLTQLISYPLGSFFPALLLAGAFILSARPIPRWLCPAAIGFGLLRSAFAAAGMPGIAYLSAMVVEPPVVLAAAWLVHRATRTAGVALSQRLLAPSLVALAVVGAIHDAWIAAAHQVPPGLLVMWVVAVPPLFGVQIHSEWERGRRVLQRAREQLEERVVERTAELARANSSLRLEISERRSAEEALRKSERQVLEARRLESLSMLTGGVAHDFNNLLAVILGNSRMAASELPPDSALHVRLARIRAAAEHGAGLTEQMLAYSGRSGVALKPVDLSHLVEEMVDLLRASISEQARLELELAPRAAVEGDTTQIRQVLLNLVTNASEALVGGAGRLLVRTGLVQQSAEDLAGAAGAERPQPGAYAYLEVVDDGQGMDATTQARVFEPFFSTKFSGRGLGLAAVLGIVRTHGGVVQIQSGIGIGTRVRVLLPERRADFADPPQSRAGGVASRRSGTILVVDDQDLVLEVAQAFLERAGHRVVTAPGGRAAIEIFRARSREIDAVLLDLAMPDASGEEVLLEIQRVRSDARVIIATGYSAQAASERLASHGVVGFVRKPYQPEEILQQVDRALLASA
jgi:signal transduction histidine kinase/ActR/RegA family two-component response regulator